MQYWPAPAKLNLFLHVLGRRDDGYHRLQTLFQFLDYADELAFEPTQDSRIERVTAITGVPPQADLSVRAAQALQQYSACSQGVRIHVRKHVPLGGGLGGGSSDAATTLLALNHLWGTGLDLTQLMRLALSLGADVPVFVQGQAAWAEGIGDELSPVTLPEAWVFVLNPGVNVATAEIFNDPELTRNSPPITIRDFQAGRARNDLEPVVRRRYPKVDQAMHWLGAFGEARMTGSGACLFLPLDDAAAGETLLAQCPAGMTGFVARTLNTHPIKALLGI